MDLHEKLRELVGHEVFLRTSLLSEEDDGVPGGVIAEVGTDYLVIHTESEDKGGWAKLGAEWLVRLAAVIHFLHIHDCKKCVQESVIERRES